ncbi:MAG: galactose mutarotase [Kiritimatiellae bacterium]|nr:galactose mutarotase [Kiritimatiellia bacterium]
MNVTAKQFGHVGDDIAWIYTISNGEGMQVSCTNYGAIITSIIVPDAQGQPGDVVLGFDTLAEYINGNDPYFGAICGRVANRINKGRFSLDGEPYELAQNNGGNALHGGIKGFDKQLWHADKEENGVHFWLISPDGDEGYPGELTCSVRYSLTSDNALVIDYHARTSRTTIINLTNHTYFNLAGHDAGSILDHEVEIRSSQYTPITEALIPTGETATVNGSPLDFTSPHRIGERIDAAGGYDHNFILDPSREDDWAVRVSEPTSGRIMEAYTTEPGIQFYTGNFLDGLTGKGGASYAVHNGFCLEAQHYPDSINHPEFPSIVLKPGEHYTQRTAYRFATA